jgi:hypothetical protein
MNKRIRSVWIVVVVGLLIGLTPSAVAASPGGAVNRGLPPLPEWPIVGPLLQRLGVVEPEAPPPPTPSPDLPEYRIADFEDLDTLEEVEAGERVRLIATDEDLNRMIAELLRQNVDGEASARLDFDVNQVTVNVQADEGVLEQSGTELPRQVRGDLNVTATVNVMAGNCRVYVEFKKVRVNRWSFGLRPVVERAINTRIPEIWPEELCVENMLFWEGEAAVEGYYR